MTAPPTIFDRSARRLRRDRHARQGGDELERHIADMILERLDAVDRAFASALIINTGFGTLVSALRARGISVDETDHGPVFASASGGLFSDEDRLDVAAGRYDLVVTPAGLDTVDDVPGALIAARRALRPGGLFMAVFPGAPTLAALRTALADAAAGDDIAVARLHPLIDVRAAGDLLARAGFYGPVADVETHTLSYPSLDRLLADLRAVGLTNVLADRYPVARATLDRARTIFAARTDDNGRVAETMSLVTMTGWAPPSR